MAWFHSLDQRSPDYKIHADEPPAGKVLCAPFSTRLHDWIITDAGLFTRPKRKNLSARVTNTLVSLVLIAYIVLLIYMTIPMGDWSAVPGCIAQIVIVIGFFIWQLIPHGYRQVLEIRENRIFAGKRDCGSLAGAYVQPVIRWNYNVMLYTREFPRGVVVASVNSRQDLEMLCANLAMHLRLNGHYDSDWPPSPQK